MIAPNSRGHKREETVKSLILKLDNKRNKLPVAKRFPLEVKKNQRNGTSHIVRRPDIGQQKPATVANQNPIDHQDQQMRIHKGKLRNTMNGATIASGSTNANKCSSNRKPVETNQNPVNSISDRDLQVKMFKLNAERIGPFVYKLKKLRNQRVPDKKTVELTETMDEISDSNLESTLVSSTGSTTSTISITSSYGDGSIALRRFFSDILSRSSQDDDLEIDNFEDQVGVSENKSSMGTITILDADHSMDRTRPSSCQRPTTTNKRRRKNVSRKGRKLKVKVKENEDKNMKKKIPRKQLLKNRFAKIRSRVIVLPKHYQQPEVYFNTTDQSSICAKFFRLAGCTKPLSLRNQVESKLHKSIHGLKTSYEKLCDSTNTIDEKRGFSTLNKFLLSSSSSSSPSMHKNKMLASTSNETKSGSGTSSRHSKKVLQSSQKKLTSSSCPASGHRNNVLESSTHISTVRSSPSSPGQRKKALESRLHKSKFTSSPSLSGHRNSVQGSTPKKSAFGSGSLSEHECKTLQLKGDYVLGQMPNRKMATVMRRALFKYLSQPSHSDANECYNFNDPQVSAIQKMTANRKGEVKTCSHAKRNRLRNRFSDFRNRHESLLN